MIGLDSRQDRGLAKAEACLERKYCAHWHLKAGYMRMATFCEAARKNIQASFSRRRCCNNHEMAESAYKRCTCVESPILAFAFGRVY